MISLGKQGDLHARRLALAYLQSKSVVAKLFSDIAPRFTDRKGGYTRLVKTRIRPGDGAPMSVVELVELREKEKKTTQTPVTSAAQAATPQ
jgi:large subunit ribosomal protein L17